MKTPNALKPSRTIRKTIVKRMVAIGLISSLGFVGAAFPATLFFTYSPHNSSDLWSQGTNWSSTPQSSLPTALIFGPSGTFSGAFSNTSTNDIGTGAFITSVLTLQGTGVSGGADTVTINSASGNYLNLDSTISLGNPQVNLTANPGSGGTLVYNVASPVTLGILPLLITGNGTADFRSSGVISGSVGINKSGASAVTFSGLNSYTGPTSVLGGTLIVGANAPAGANGALGNAISAIMLGGTSGSSSASLIAGGAFTIGRDISVQAGSSGVATIGGNTTSSSSFTGNITLSKDVTLQSVTTGTSAVTFSTGVISGGFGITKAGSGTVVLGGANTYSGSTTVNQGTLRAGVVTQAFGVTSAVTMANTVGAILDLAGYNNTIGSLAGGGSTGGNVNKEMILSPSPNGPLP